MFAGFVLMILVVMMFALFTETGGEIMDRAVGGDVVAFSLTTHVPLLLLCMVIIFATGLRWGDLKLHRLNLMEIVYAAVLALIAFAGALVISLIAAALYEIIKPGFIEESLEKIEVLENLMETGTAMTYIRTLIFLALLPALLEELFFRGLLMDSFMRWGAFWAIMLSAFAFALSHQMLLRIPGLFVVGVIFGWYKYKTGKLTASILLHLIYNCFIVSLTFVAERMIPSV
jgi:membrane protease YdiL (CAAX protease family)